MHLLKYYRYKEYKWAYSLRMVFLLGPKSVSLSLIECLIPPALFSSVFLNLCETAVR